MNRTVGFYAYLAVLAAVVVGLNFAALPYDAAHPDQTADVLYLFAAVAALSLADVKLDRGHLTLGAVATGASALLMNPLDTTIVCLGVAFTQAPRGVRAI